MSEGKVRLWHKNGMEVLLPIPVDFNSATGIINDYIQSGWLSKQPDPLHEQIIGYVAKRARIDKRSGEEIPILDLYGAWDGMPKRFIVRYINTQEHRSEFESATGLNLDEIPLYDGDQPVIRGSKLASKYIVQFNTPVKIFYKDNPKYEAVKHKSDQEKSEEEKKIPARLFVSWGEPVADFPNWNTSTPKQASSAKNTSPSAPENGSNNHWANDPDNRKKVIDTFKTFQIEGTDAIVKAMGEIEEGVSKLSQSKAKTVGQYCDWIRQMYEAW